VSVVDRRGQEFAANILACNTSEYPDIGLLHVADQIATPLPCASHNGSGPVIIRGSAQGVLTSQVNMRGWVYGEESTNSGVYLDLVLSDLAIIERLTTGEAVDSSDVYAAVRGLSGGPVVFSGAFPAPTTIGVIAKRNTQGIANRLYAIPIRNAADFLIHEGFFLQVRLPLLSEGSSLGTLTGRLISRLLNSSLGMHELWEEVSGLFYSGLPMDRILIEFLRDPEIYGIEDGIIVHELQYLLARLMQKRGLGQDAMRLLHSAVRGARLGRSPAHRRLSALINLRQISAVSFAPQATERWTAFERAVGEYEDLSEFSDEERAYEISSALGAEAGEISIDERFLSGHKPAQIRFTHLTQRHRDLLRMYPRSLTEKQEVVALMLDLTSILWDFDSRLMLEEQAGAISNVTTHGTIAALQRSNAIFYSQMMIGRAIAARKTGDDETAFFLAGLAADSLRKSRLTFEHEGLKVLIAYLNRVDPKLANYMNIILSTGAETAQLFFIRQPMSESHSENICITEALRHIETAGMAISSIADLLEITP
jgi:hypothetical protein